MTLENYIKDLLYRYDCVIVPDFGGFVMNTKSAKINENTFSPPYKQITFNSLLQNNDGLLANHIASVDKMPYETAINFISFEVEQWIEKLMDNELDLKGIGSFSMENDTIQFEPDSQINYLTSSFGLSSYISDTIERVQTVNKEIKQIALVDNRAVYKKQVVALEEKTPIYLTLEKRKNSANFLKYAAVFLLGSAIIGLLGTKIYQDNLEKQQVVKIQKLQKQRENEIQAATFIISSPLPTITINTSIPVEKYHIVAGAFRDKANAIKKVNQLTKKGFAAKIIGKNKWNLTQVAFTSFSSLEKANLELIKIKNNVAKDAWLLIKE